jgi:aryl-alcohol dehydrogenase-like predicted oxidoreductase
VPSIEDAGAILDVLQKFDLNEVDTARGYGGGSCEEYLAELKWQERGIVLATKLSPAATPSPGSYTHKPEDLRRGIQASLAALKTDKLDLVSRSFQLFHQPTYQHCLVRNHIVSKGRELLLKASICSQHQLLPMRSVPQR